MKSNFNPVNRTNRIQNDVAILKQNGILTRYKDRYSDYLADLLSKIENAETASIAGVMLVDASRNSRDLEMIDYVLFKQGKHYITNCLKDNGEKMTKNLALLNKLNLSIIPQHIETIEKDNSSFVVTQISGSETGHIVPYLKGGNNNVPKEAKLRAYKDLQILTKAGLIDDKYKKAVAWYYTPNGEICLPDWQGLRKIRPDESQKEILENYYNILFQS